MYTKQNYEKIVTFGTIHCYLFLKIKIVARAFSLSFRAILVLRLRTANLLLGATLSFSDSNNFHSLAHTDNIYFNFSCFSKKEESSYLCQLYMIRQVSDTSIRG